MSNTITLLTAEAAYQQVQEQAEKIRNNAQHDLRNAAWSVGDAWAQSDIAITLRGKADAPADSIGLGKLTPLAKPEAQLAPGHAKGSRYVVHAADMPHLRFFLRENPTAIDGPVFLATQDFCIAHPDHRWVTLPKGWYSIEYDRTYKIELRDPNPEKT